MWQPYVKHLVLAEKYNLTELFDHCLLHIKIGCVQGPLQEDPDFCNISADTLREILRHHIEEWEPESERLNVCLRTLKAGLEEQEKRESEPFWDVTKIVFSAWKRT